MWWVPRQWTDLVAAEPHAALGEGRTYFRVADLVELSHHVAQLGGGHVLDGLT
jgi:hypothetical protein